MWKGEWLLSWLSSFTDAISISKRKTKQMGQMLILLTLIWEVFIWISIRTPNIWTGKKIDVSSVPPEKFNYNILNGMTASFHNFSNFFSAICHCVVWITDSNIKWTGNRNKFWQILVQCLKTGYNCFLLEPSFSSSIIILSFDTVCLMPQERIVKYTETNQTNKTF